MNKPLQGLKRNSQLAQWHPPVNINVREFRVADEQVQSSLVKKQGPERVNAQANQSLHTAVKLPNPEANFRTPPGTLAL